MGKDKLSGKGGSLMGTVRQVLIFSYVFSFRLRALLEMVRALYHN